MIDITASLNPSERQLRQFGLVSLFALAGITWLWGGAFRTILIALGIGAVLALLAHLAPKVIKPVFVLVTLVTLPIGLVIGEVLLFVIYALLFVPTAIAFRLIGRDALQRTLEHRKPSYWESKRRITDINRYFQQY